MAKIQKSNDALRNALLEYGDTLFRICYLHTQQPKAAEAVMEDIFLQYLLHDGTFDSRKAEEAWLIRTTHKSCMDYYSKKMRKKLSPAQLRTAAQHMPFQLSDELCAMLRLSYRVKTQLVLCTVEGKSVRQGAKLTDTMPFFTRQRLAAAEKKLHLSVEEIGEWLQEIELPQELRSKILYGLQNTLHDKHFGINSSTQRIKRAMDRAVPFVAAGVVVFAVLCVLAVRGGWFGTTYVPDETLAGIAQQEHVPTASDPAESHVTLATPTPQPVEDGSLVVLHTALYIPDEAGLVQYDIRQMPADAGLLTAAMAQRGAFPETVVLQNIRYLQNGEEAQSLKTGEQLEVQLYFSPELQSYIDDSGSAAVLEAIAKTFRAFFESARMSVSKLEIYTGDAPVTVGGTAISSTALMYGELPVTRVIEEEKP